MSIPLEKAWEHLQASNPRFLGGSTGAVQMTLPSGKKVVVKRGAHPKHITNEFDFNRYLHELGVGVPEASLQRDESGLPLMLTEFESGARQPSLSSKKDMELLQEDFVPQALIANWDALGMNMDNVLIRPDGTPSYVDVGGSGPYRAQGAEKGFNWVGRPRLAGTPQEGRVDELETMKVAGVYPSQNQYVYGRAGILPEDADVGASWDKFGGGDAMEQALSVLRDKQTRDVMGQRIDWLRSRLD